MEPGLAILDLLPRSLTLPGLVCFGEESDNSSAVQQPFEPVGEILRRSRRPLTPANRLDGNGGRCRIRTYDFHRVKMALYR